jgi:hypothetical protein
MTVRTLEASLSDRALKPLHPSDSASGGSPDRASDRCSVCLGRSSSMMQQIMHYDAEFRREEATSAVGSSARH